MLRRSPGTTFVVAGLLALGIGGTTLVFSVFDAVLLRPLPVRHPEQLVRVVQRLPRIGTDSSLPLAYYRALSEHSTALVGVFGETGRYLHFAMSDPAPAEQIAVHFVTPEFFETLGVPASYGRALIAEDNQEKPGMPPAVLSNGFWRRRFNSDPKAIGRTLTLRGHRFVIVGIMSRDFNGITVDTVPDVRVPLRAYSLLANLRLDFAPFELAGRLKPGLTRAQAAAECQSIWRSTMESYYRDVQKHSSQTVSILVNRGIDLDPLERGVSILRDRFGAVLKLLMASVGVLLLIVCTNVAGILLTQATARRSEIAVRLAIGATRVRLARQVLVESLLLGFLGAAGGLFFALVSAPLARRALPPLRDLGTNPLPLSIDIRIDHRVFLFSLALTVLTVLAFSLTPLITCTRTSLDSVLRSVRASGHRVRRVLVLLQIAACTFLLAMASLFMHTFRELQTLNPGFDRDHVATFTADLEAAGYTDKTAGPFLELLTERIRQLPGVVSVAIASRGVMRGRGLGMTAAPAGQRTTHADFMNTSVNTVTPEYFETMGMQILAGRGLRVSDTPAAKPVPPTNVVVNQAFARRAFPNASPLGKQFGTALEAVAGANYEIVGVVSDAKYRSLREPMVPTIYTSRSGNGYFDDGSVVLNVRTRTRPDAILEPVRKTLASIDPALSFLEVHTLEEEVEASTAGDRLVATLASIFGALAALLAGVGIYGILASALIQRRREIGVRMAVGARPSQIWRLFASQTLGMAAGGIVVGLGAVLLAGPAIRSMLYGISPQDPKSLAAAAMFVVFVAAAATAAPARQAVLVDPASALRQDN